VGGQAGFYAGLAGRLVEGSTYSSGGVISLEEKVLGF